MRKFILILALAVSSLCAVAQGTTTYLTSMAVGTDYDPVTSKYTWTEFTPIYVMMHVSENSDVITIFSKQVQVFQVLSSTEISDDVMTLECTSDGVPVDVTFLIMSDATYLIVDYQSFCVMYKFHEQ